MRLKFFLVVVFFIGSILLRGELFAQSYGLGFSAHLVDIDKRTGLDLSAGRSLCFNKDFEVSFEMSFLSGQINYFGYVVRIISDEGINLDLIYDNNPGKKHFNLVTGDSFSDFIFKREPQTLFNDWLPVKFKYSFDRQSIKFSIGNRTFEQPLKLARNSCFKILFGANEYAAFKTKDVPPMKIRDVKVYEESVLKHYWRLQEESGTVARDEVGDTYGEVINPLWVKKMHYEWQLQRTFKARGAASVAFNSSDETVYIVGSDSLLTYSVSENLLTGVKYSSGTRNLLRGNGAIYNSHHNQLFNFYPDQKIVSTFDFAASSWDSDFRNDSLTNYWHSNKFYSASDSSLYILGGYGHFLYKNTISRYHFPSKTWEEVRTTGDHFTPRYLAASGAVNEGAYILGGYGSATGKQLLNPKTFYDLLYFDGKNRKIKKIYELESPYEDFVFSNSMIIDEDSRSYYALIFPKLKYDSSLQLIKGSLDEPSFQVLGSKIPYLFHDINSFSDLFYCPASKRFIAVTLVRSEDNETQVKVYSLNSPPISRDNEVEASPKALVFPYYIIALVVISVGAIGILLYYRKRRRIVSPYVAADQPTENLVTATAAVPVSDTDTLSKEVPADKEPPPPVYRSSIFAFGDLQLFDDSGDEITKHFTPLIKELFLVILLYTLRWGRGISSEKLKELLWFDKSVERARNNRSVNIAKLKSILENIKGCHIVKESGHWKMDIDFAHIDVDYFKYLTIVKDKALINKDKVIALGKITERGSFLSNAEYEWLDPFKSEISNDIVDTYLHFCNSVNIASDPEFLIKVANNIFYFDPVNEEAMAIKCKALYVLGKHSLAKNTYENFSREYKTIYGEEFDKQLPSILD